MNKVVIEALSTPIMAEYDIVVVGGGIAGVSAALAAKRSGMHVLLIEKSTMLGGLATLGLIAIYLPLCDGKGRKVIGGIAEELLHLSILYGYDNLPDTWRTANPTNNPDARYRTAFSPSAFVIALDELMEREGIHILLDTVFSRPIMQEGVLDAVVVENKSGRIAYGAKMVVDATGDLDVLSRAGASYVESDNWLSYWAYTTDLNQMKRATQSGRIADGIALRTWGGDNKGSHLPSDTRKYIGTDGEEVTRFILEGRKLLRGEVKRHKEEEVSLLTLPGMAQFRTTRRIQGVYALKEEDVFLSFDDSIGCTGDWRKAGPIFEIPYRALISPTVKNIITAGRSIASIGDVWEVTRVIPVAALTGQAAGAAAALAVTENCALQEISITKLQHVLTQAGVMIHHT